MSAKKPIIAITGGSGAGTTTVSKAFRDIFRREKISASFLAGDSFRRFDYEQMEALTQEKENCGENISHFGPEANLFDELESQLKLFSETGRCKKREYITKDNDKNLGKFGTFTQWREIKQDRDILVYEGFHGGVVSNKWTRRKMSDSHNPKVQLERRSVAKKNGVDVAQYVDLLIGIVPVVNLEWIQKIHRDTNIRGIERGNVTTTIIQRMQDYIHFIVPQFSYSDINFQRIPLVDTSNPFIIRDIPNADESLYVIRFRDPKKYDILYFVDKISGAYLSRPNTMVIPGGKLQLAIEVICSPIIQKLCQN
ncbi:Phosphoribulokinase [hydrothermal vent metagenome]|uniref:phosphoribulokinase n=1 Tax=hydrothermal vent metagenome TaxID=652676 RepID=A0A3B1APL8_9ZZZZ